MTDRPALYQLIETRLGEPLARFIADRRPLLSWRQLAALLEERTSTAVSFESLRQWFADSPVSAGVAKRPEPIVEVEGQHYRFIGRSTDGDPLYSPIDPVGPERAA